jgi:hypothetical protein
VPSYLTPSDTIEKQGDQMRGAGHPAQHETDLFRGQNRRQTRGLSRADDVLQPWQRVVEHVPIEKEQRTQRLVASRR